MNSTKVWCKWILHLWTLKTLKHLNLADKVNLKKSDNMLLYQILLCTTDGTIKESHAKAINLKYHL